MRERYPPLCPFPATRNPGAGQDFTGLAAAVQLRLRVAVGLQALQRCSGLLNRRARGSTVATHHPSLGTEQREGFKRRMSSIGLAKEDFSLIGFQAMDGRPCSTHT